MGVGAPEKAIDVAKAPQLETQDRSVNLLKIALSR